MISRVKYEWIGDNLRNFKNCYIPRFLVRHYGEEGIVKAIKNQFNYDVELQVFVIPEIDKPNTIDYVVRVLE